MSSKNHPKKETKSNHCITAKNNFIISNCHNIIVGDDTEDIFRAEKGIRNNWTGTITNNGVDEQEFDVFIEFFPFESISKTTESVEVEAKAAVTISYENVRRIYAVQNESTAEIPGTVEFQYVYEFGENCCESCTESCSGSCSKNCSESKVQKEHKLQKSPKIAKY